MSSSRTTHAKSRTWTCRDEHRSADRREHRATRARGGDALLVPRLRDERDRGTGAAGRARRPQAGAPPDPLLDVRLRAPARAPAPQVRERRRRRHGELPPPRRLRDLRRPGPPRPGLRDAVPADRPAGQLRLDRQRLAGGHAVHRGAPVAARHGDAPRHRRGHRRVRPELRRVEAGAARPAVALPEPAGERLVRHRGRDGHEHPAAQPERGDRRGRRLHRRPADRRRRA